MLDLTQCSCLGAALRDALERFAGEVCLIEADRERENCRLTYAIFYGGGVIVPLDYKLTAAEQLQLLAHSRARFLIVEYHLWRAIMTAPDFRELKAEVVLVTEAPAKAELGRARRWEDAKSCAVPRFITR